MELHSPGVMGGGKTVGHGVDVTLVVVKVLLIVEVTVLVVVTAGLVEMTVI